MAKTKQTARNTDSSGRQAGMESVVLQPQHEEVPEEEETAQGEAQGESLEKVQEGIKEVEVVTLGEKVTGEQDPIDPVAQPGLSISKASVVGTSTGTLGVVAYMKKSQEFARVWFKEVVEKKEVAYRDFIASLVSPS